MKSFNGAPITARINPDDINPLLPLLFLKTNSPRNAEIKPQAFICSLTSSLAQAGEKRASTGERN